MQGPDRAPPDPSSPDLSSDGLSSDGPDGVPDRMGPGALRRVIRLLTPRERRNGALLLGLIALMALFEMIGVAAIMPFLAVLADPGMIESNRPLAALHARLGAPDPTQFLLWLGLGAIGLILLGALLRTLTEFAMNRFIQLQVHSLGVRLLSVYLRQPYEFHITRHGGALQKTVLSEAERVVSSVIWPGLLLIANGAVLVAMAALLVSVDPVVAAAVAGVLGLTYGLIYLGVRSPIRRVGVDSVRADAARYEAAGEALAGIKDIRLRGVERFYLDRFARPSERLARAQAFTHTIANVPKYAVEAVAFCGLVALALALMLRHGGAGTAALGAFLPLIGLYAFAGVRMLPAVQGLYRGATMVSFGDAALDSVARDLSADTRLPPSPATPPAPLPLTRALVLDAVSYRYPGAPAPGLTEISLTIPAGSSLGVVGRTGAGKTTLIDLLLGLLTPSQGRLLVDGTEVTAARRAEWAASVGYVPQDIFLLDASIAENIALGLPHDQIDPARVARAARLAQLTPVLDALPEGLATRVGERGIKLSGGQRQRVGIARALYHDPALLVFDEATSALDSATEREVMAALNELAGTRTIVMIAHRLSTVEHCDAIAVMEGGCLVGLGSYGELIATSPQFRAIASAA